MFNYISTNGGELVENKDTDLAYDLRAVGYQKVINGKLQDEITWMNNGDSVKLHFNETILIKSGIQLQFPKPEEVKEKGKVVGKTLYGASVLGRSGLNLKGDLLVKTGTIDSEYEGDIGAVITNMRNGVNTINYGDRIAQLKIEKVFKPAKEMFIQVDSFKTDSDNKRGQAGFGSTD